MRDHPKKKRKKKQKQKKKRKQKETIQSFYNNFFFLYIKFINYYILPRNTKYHLLIIIDYNNCIKILKFYLFVY